MSSSAFALVAVTEEHTRELPMSPYAFGAIAFVSFMVALGVLWFFRGAAQKLAAASGTPVLLTSTDRVGEALAGAQLGTWFAAKPV
jgi:hypothetical protein